MTILKFGNEDRIRYFGEANLNVKFHVFRRHYYFVPLHAPIGFKRQRDAQGRGSDSQNGPGRTGLIVERNGQLVDVFVQLGIHRQVSFLEDPHHRFVRRQNIGRESRKTAFLGQLD